MPLDGEAWALLDLLDERGSVNDWGCIRYLQAETQAAHEGFQECAGAHGHFVVTILDDFGSGARSQPPLRYRAY